MILDTSDRDLWNIDLLDTNTFRFVRYWYPHYFFSKTSWRCLQDMSSGRLQDMSSRRLQDVLEDKKLLCWRLFEDVFKASSRPTDVCWAMTQLDFMWILRNFSDQLLNRIPGGNCFWKWNLSFPFYVLIISSYLFRNSHLGSSTKNKKVFAKPGVSAYHGVLKIGFRRSCFRVDFAKRFRTSTLCKIAYNFLFNVLWNCCYLMMSHVKAWSSTFLLLLLLLLLSLPLLFRESFDLITVILLTPFIGSVD